jgi:hypothetical protein
VECDAISSYFMLFNKPDRNLPTFRKNLLPPSSKSLRKRSMTRRRFTCSGLHSFTSGVGMMCSMYSLCTQPPPPKPCLALRIRQHHVTSRLAYTTYSYKRLFV